MRLAESSTPVLTSAVSSHPFSRHSLHLSPGGQRLFISNREGTWSAAYVEIGGQAGGKIPEAGEATQDGRERACEVVTNSVQTLRPEWPTRYRLRRCFLTL